MPIWYTPKHPKWCNWNHAKLCTQQSPQVLRHDTQLNGTLHKGLYMIFIVNDTQHSNVLFTVKLSVITLNVVMLSVVMLSVVMLRVVAPKILSICRFFYQQYLCR